MFLFDKSKQMAYIPNTLPPNIPITHLPNLLYSPLFHSPPPTISLPPILPIVFTSFRQTTNPTLISPYACLSNDHSLGRGSPPSELHFSKFDVVGSCGSIDGSPKFATTSLVFWSDSPVGLNLVVDVSSYSL